MAEGGEAAGPAGELELMAEKNKVAERTIKRLQVPPKPKKSPPLPETRRLPRC